MIITKKAIIQAATEVAERAPHAKNRSDKVVDRRHPRGLIGHTLRTAGLSPKQISSGYGEFLNPAATRWAVEADTLAKSGMQWRTIVSSVR